MRVILKHFLLIFAGFAGAILLMTLCAAGPAPQPKKASLGDIECDSLTIYGEGRKTKLSIKSTETGVSLKMGRENGPFVSITSYLGDVWVAIEGTEKSAAEIGIVGRNDEVFLQIRGPDGWFYVQPNGLERLKK